ncbi:MAG: anti-sigma factor antagonist [Firmicutes bacterium]|nr:anti-sigma factor antagonist [Bacillota bacterium]
MNVTYKDNDTIFFLEGRIDSGNAAETEYKIFQRLSAKYVNKIIFSLENLEYISSAGLRVLLKVKKKYPDISVVNVSKDLYEIFDMTGFTNILNVEKPLKEISVKNCDIISDTNNSTVYRISKDNVLKLLKGKNTRKKAEEEFKRAKTAFIGGVSTAIPYEIVSCNSSYGLIYELLACRPLSDYISEHPEDTSKCAVRFAQLLRDIHSLDIDLSGLPNIKDLFMQYLDNSLTIYNKEEINTIGSLIKAMPDDKRLIHNNYQPDNIMVHDNELILIDMGNVCCGHPIFDFGSSWLTFRGSVDTHLTKYTGLSSENRMLFWVKFLQTYYDEKGSSALNLIEKQIAASAQLRLALALGSYESYSSSLKTIFVENMRKNFFPKAGEYKEAILSIK